MKNLDLTQQIKFIGGLNRDSGATVFFCREKNLKKQLLTFHQMLDYTK